MIYFQNSIPSPSVTMYAVDECAGVYVKVVVDNDRNTYGGLRPGAYIGTETMAGLSDFEDCREASGHAFACHFREANEIILEQYLDNTVRPIPADI